MPWYGWLAGALVAGFFAARALIARMNKAEDERMELHSLKAKMDHDESVREIEKVVLKRMDEELNKQGPVDPHEWDF